MAMNPTAPSGAGVNIPGLNNQPYPTLSPGQGGVGPGAGGPPDPSQQGGPGGPGGAGESDRDKIREVIQLGMSVGLKQPEDLLKFLAGLGFQTASRLARPANPRGITGDMEQAQAGQAGPPAPPMPPQISAAPMPPVGM